MKSGTYVGPIAGLKGKHAKLKEDRFGGAGGRKWLAQFEDTDLKFSKGWHCFHARDFEIEDGEAQGVISLSDISLAHYKRLANGGDISSPHYIHGGGCAPLVVHQDPGSPDGDRTALIVLMAEADAMYQAMCGVPEAVGLASGPDSVVVYSQYTDDVNHYAEQLAQGLGLQSIIRDWAAGDGYPDFGCLVSTNDPLIRDVWAERGSTDKIMGFWDAMKKAGLWV